MKMNKIKALQHECIHLQQFNIILTLLVHVVEKLLTFEMCNLLTVPKRTRCLGSQKHWLSGWS